MRYREKSGFSLFEMLIASVISGAAIGTAVWKSLPSAKSEAKLLGYVIEQTIAVARLSETPHQLKFQQNGLLVSGGSNQSRLKIKSEVECDNCDLEISVRGVSQPATVALQARERCLVVISLRGRVRVTCES